MLLNFWDGCCQMNASLVLVFETFEQAKKAQNQRERQ
jgi:hypothetical protein